MTLFFTCFKRTKQEPKATKFLIPALVRNTMCQFPVNDVKSHNRFSTPGGEKNTYLASDFLKDVNKAQSSSNFLNTVWIFLAVHYLEADSHDFSDEQPL